jgi:hypothetical protein
MTRLRTLWDLMNMPCEGMARLSSESLDRELGRLEQLTLKSHLIYCIACRRYLRQLKFMRAALERFGPQLKTDDPLAGPRLPDKARARIKRALSDQ